MTKNAEPGTRQPGRAGSRARGRLRVAVQAGTGILFVACLAAASLAIAVRLPVDLFFLADPFLQAAVVLSSGSGATAGLACSAVVLLVTILFGRIFCGYACPLGTLLDLVPAGDRPRGGTTGRSRAAWMKRLPTGTKFLLLGASMAAAAGGVQLAYLVDPIGIAWRGIAAILSLAGSGGDAALASTRGGAWFAVVLLAIVLSLNLFARRLWCRSLCPLGALLGLAGSGAPFRRFARPETCTGCGTCVDACPMGALADGPFGRRASECIVCLRCRDACPERAVSLGWGNGFREALVPSRRSFLLVGAGALVGVAAARAGAVAADEEVLRPPGSIEGEAFNAACVRCTICVEVCPTATIETRFHAGSMRIDAAEFVPALGGCDPACHACGLSCPTGAIRPLTLEAKRRAVIGRAVVRWDRCLRNFGEDCRICEEACPYEAVVLRSRGNALRPSVVRPGCNGCGICEFRCPARRRPGRDGRRISAIAVRRHPPGAEPAAPDERFLPPFLQGEG